MQLVNWGGFHGITSIDFSPATTLVSGASGTGKSTILDAYVALMMDSNTPFNGASNDAGTGRARGATQRSLLTYLRGKTDDAHEDGVSTAKVLRGSNSSTWGAITATFVDDHGNRFTALRLYFVARSVSRDSEIVKKLCTVPGSVDVKEFEPLAADRFDKRSVESRFPSLKVHDTYEAFAVAVHTRLGIGSVGGGSNALRLLGRIQAGRPITTVDDLYKSMVLDTPATFAAADRAIDHFTDLEAAYGEMVTAADKQAALQPIVGLWGDYEEELANVSAVDRLGMSMGADSPFAHWAATYEAHLIEVAVQRKSAELKVERAAETAAAEREGELGTQLNAVIADIDGAGGATLTAIDTELDARRDELVKVQAARAKLNIDVAELGLRLETIEDFSQVFERASEFLKVEFDEQARALETERDELNKRAWPLETEEKELKDERESLKGRAGRVPKPMHDARVEAAAAAGLSPADLPFVAELIDVAPAYSEWRTAAELVFGGLARVMLVDEHHLDHLSRSIDHLDWKIRLNFEGVQLLPFAPRTLNPALLSGRLLYADSPYSHWIVERLSNAGIDALCVPTPAELSGGGRRVTRSGQTRHGQSGAHGRTNSGNVIGFDSKAREDEIDARLAAIRSELEAIEPELETIRVKQRQLSTRRDAYRVIVATTWESIDVAGVQSRIASLDAERREIIESNDVLRDLQQRRDRLEKERDAAAKLKYGSQINAESLDGLLVDLDERLVEVRAEVVRLERSGRMLSEFDAQALSDKFVALDGGDEYDKDRFPQQLARLSQTIGRERSAAESAATKAKESLERVFEAFQARWLDPNLGVAVESYPDYRQILDDITATGLHERREEWVRRLASWTGDDLVPLNAAFEAAVEEIEDRLRPVNAILTELPFGAHRDRLRIELRRLHRDDHAAFRAELRQLSSGTTGVLGLEHAETKFKLLRTFIDRLRPSARSGERSQRDYLLDVHRHIELSATITAADGTIRATYRSLGEKSGGETQELIAFIVGAALRFQLGDETRSRPRFAPVFLDEGFVKADSEFAGRGVSAWKGLGFQLIVAAPLDKVTALEPHMDRILQVTKRPDTGRSRVTDLTEGPTS